MQQNAKAFSARLRTSACVCGKKIISLSFKTLGKVVFFCVGGILLRRADFAKAALAATAESRLPTFAEGYGGHGKPLPQGRHLNNRMGWRCASQPVFYKIVNPENPVNPVQPVRLQ
jgi:hypothetical protein